MRALLSLARLWPPAALPGTPRCTGGALHAEAAFFGVGRRIRGMICASNCARSAAVVRRQKAVRVHTALPRTEQVYER
jgi:hypothetical protein